MSGGHFYHDQYKIRCIADEIENVIRNNDSEEKDELENSVGRHYPEEVLQKFREAFYYLRVGEIYAQRADWLLSGDDGEDSFLQRLQEDLNDFHKSEEYRRVVRRTV